MCISTSSTWLDVACGCTARPKCKGPRRRTGIGKPEDFYEAADVAVHEIVSPQPHVTFRAADGNRQQIWADAYAQACEALARLGVTDRLPGIVTPVLAVAGGENTPTPGGIAGHPLRGEGQPDRGAGL